MMADSFDAIFSRNNPEAWTAAHAAEIRGIVKGLLDVVEPREFLPDNLERNLFWA